METKSTHGGSGRGQGRKPKSGTVITFRPSQKVADILNNIKGRGKTAFIEKAIISYHDKIQHMIIEADEASERFGL